MLDEFKIRQILYPRQNWRKYQRKLKRNTTQKYLVTKIFQYLVIFLFLFFPYQLFDELGEAVYYNNQIPFQKSSVKRQKGIKLADRMINKKDIRNLIDSKVFTNLTNKNFEAVSKGLRLSVETTIDESLQNFILEKIDKTTPRYIGIVVSEPYSGRILAMAGYDKHNPENNTCTENIFPAASVFKIITTAAAIEKYGFNASSEISFSGRKHTLYHFQLENQTKRKENPMTLEESFAQSVNPVFGKIGIHYLGKETLEQYANAFGFNQDIAFEIPLASSSVFLSDDPYHLAEIASGFNRETSISPLHGALIGCTILNEGRLIEPVIIEKIRDEKNRILYERRWNMVNRAIKSETSQIIHGLMEATIESGTCKKAFKHYEEDDVLSKLNIGGKTGSIGSRTQENYYYDWFVGFAEEKQGTEKIVISICIAHEKYMGIRANQYARMIIKEYFSRLAAKNFQGEENMN